MAATYPDGLKRYLRRQWSSSGSITYNGVTYTSNEIGNFANAIFSEASQEVVIIQSGFEGGYSTGQIKCDKQLLLQVVEELIEELGIATIESNRQLMTFADWSQGTATT